MIGKRLADRYEITGELGRGGMGVVYRAHDPVLERDVAIKVAPRALDAEARQRLRREATVVAQMDHPAIVPVHDMGEDAGSLFFVMPVVPGANLRVHLAEGTLRVDEVLDIGQQVAEGLEYSHLRGVLHRDVKPENILVERDQDGRVRARITDFGLAWTGLETRLTQTGSLIGTIAYLSPEQISDQDIDERTDIYSLAVVLYECLAGTPPFAGETHSVLYRIVYEQSVSLRSAGVDVVEGIDSLIAKALSKSPRERPASAAEFAGELASFIGAGDGGKALIPPPRDDSPRAAAEAPFVGREAELAELRRRLDAALEGECQLAVIHADAGAGKTRLVEELGRIAGARDIRVLRGRFSGQERDLPFNGFCEVIQDYFRIKEVSPSSTGLPDLSDLAGELLAAFPMLGEIRNLRGAAGDKQSHSHVTDADRSRLFELMARALARIGHGRPLVIVLEDLHEARVSAEALPYIVRRLAPTPTLIIATSCRTEVDARHPILRMVESMASSSETAVLELAPLTADQIGTLLGRLTGKEIDPDLSERIRNSTDGNPLFAQELFRSLEQSEDLVETESGFRLRHDVSVITGELPATLRQAVERRIERLSSDLSRLLAEASVIGRSFDYRELEELAGAEHPSLDDEIDRLIEEGLLREERESPGDRLAFVSGIVREAVYATLTRRRKRSLHRKLGDFLERRSDGDWDRVAARLAFHFARADDADRAVRFGLIAARVALDACSVDEALEHVQTVLEFIDDESLEGGRGPEGEAWRLAAMAHRVRRDVAAVLRAVDRSVAAYAREGADDEALSSMVLGARTAWENRLVEQAAEWSQRAVDVAERAGRQLDRREAFLLASTIANLRGHHAEAAALRDRAGDDLLLDKAAGREERRGGRVVVGLTTQMDDFDPGRSLTAEEDEVLANVFETLLATNDRGDLVPALCERWEVLDSGRGVLLHLRRGVRFHDGTPLDARAVKRALEGALDHSFGRAATALGAVFNIDGRQSEGKRIPDLAGIVVEGEHCVRIRLGRAFPAFPRVLTSPAMAIAHRREGALPLGTGPFEIAEADGERAVLSARHDHWSETVPQVDEIEFRLGLEPEALLTALEAGTVDLGRQLPVEVVEPLANDPAGPIRIVDSPKKNVYFVLFSARGSRHVPAAVRRALIRGVRYDKLVRETLGRCAEAATSVIPPGILGFDPGQRPRPGLSAETVRELIEPLREGDADFEIDAAIHPVFARRYGRLLDRLAATWSDLGIRIRNVTPSLPAFLRAAQSGDLVHVVFGRWTADYDDPDNFTHALFHSLDGNYRALWSDDELDRLGEKARRETDPLERHRFYRSYLERLDEAEVVAPLFHDNDLAILGRGIRRARMTGSAPYVDYGRLEVRRSHREVSSPGLSSVRAVHIPSRGRIINADPARAWTGTAFEILPNIFETLTRVSQVGGVRPWLAASFETDEDGLVHRFRLRDDVRFHDGRRLTARDVRYTFERVLRNASTRIDILSCIRGARELMRAETISLEGFEVLSNSEFVLHLVEPMQHLPLALASPTVAIIPDGAVPLSRGGEGLVGTGPFRIDHFEPGRSVELSAHADYWRDAVPRSRRIVFELGVTPEESIEGLRSGHFGLTTKLPSVSLDELRRDSKFAGGIREAPGLATAFLALNSRSGPLSDIEARRRVLAALDAEGIVATALARPWAPATGLFPPELKGVESTRRTTRLPRQVSADASALKLKMAVPIGGDDAWQRVAEEIVVRLAEVRVGVEIVNRNFQEYFRLVDEGGVDLVIGRWHATYPDCDSFAHGLLHSEFGTLRSLVSLPELDRLIATGRRESDPVLRGEAYQRIEGLLSRQSLLLPMFHAQVCCVSRPDLRGVRLTLGRPSITYDELSYRD